MLRFSTNNHEFNMVDLFAFDMDGTLYDEFDFIRQAYGAVAGYIACDEGKFDSVYSFLLDTWMEYGSSKTDTFQLAFQKADRAANETDIKKCIELFRNCEITLSLAERTKCILNLIKRSGKEMILITDGNSVLQRRKIDALGLQSWFSEGSIFISGDYGKEYQKPGTLILEKVKEKRTLEEKKVCYLGDRQIDKRFADAAGFEFYYAPCMQIAEGRSA